MAGMDKLGGWWGPIKEKEEFAMMFLLLLVSLPPADIR